MSDIAGFREVPSTFSSGDDDGDHSEWVRLGASSTLEELPPSLPRGLQSGGWALVAFAVLNGTLGLCFGHLFKTESVTFWAAAKKHDWDPQLKGDACIKAGLGWFLVAALALANPLVSQWLGVNDRVGSLFCRAKNGVKQKCRRFVPKEKLTLLGYTRKGSDESDDEMEARRPV